MGLLLSILLSYVGGIELVFVIRDVTHQVCLHQRRRRINSNDQAADLKRIQDNIRRSLAEVIKEESETTERMQDGVIYDNGYRIDDDDDAATLDKWNEQRKKLAQEDEDNANGNNSNETFLRNERTSNGTVNSGKTQNGHANEEKNKVEYLKTKLSEESSSYEPLSQQSSMSMDMPEIHFDEYDRQAEEAAMNGVKFRPIKRDDGRRKAFKKRLSSSSTDSGDANVRLSREDELKMFTSLEEEEMASMKNDYVPIQYSSDPKAKKHSRRRKRSPVLDGSKKSSGGASEDDETPPNGTDPWGNVQPQHIHDTELWKKERTTSIVEEQEADERLASSPHLKALRNSGIERASSPVGPKTPKIKSFEDATDSQHEMIINSLTGQSSKDDVKKQEASNSPTGKNVSIAASEITIPLSAHQNKLNENACAQLSINVSDDSAALPLVESSFDVTFNLNEDQQRTLSKEEQELKNIQAQIEQINQSFNPVARELLSTTSITKTITESTRRFIESEEIYEEITRSPIITPSASEHGTLRSVQPNYEVGATEVCESSNIIQEHPDISNELEKKFVTKEELLIIDPATEDQPQERLDIKTGAPTVSDQSPIVESLPSTSYSREESLISIDSVDINRRSISTGSTADDLEYIRGRSDWRDQHRISVNAEIESDEYHHNRRFSETAETLEYIRGRDDWLQYQERLRELIPKVRESDENLSRVIDQQIDSDEYHHARRLSECLDLAYHISRYHEGAGKFVTQGSARNGRERSPYKVLRSEVCKDEFIDRYYWKGATNERNYNRSVSEQLTERRRDLAEEQMIEHERLIWEKGNPGAAIQIMIEDTDDGEISQYNVGENDGNGIDYEESDDERSTIIEMNDWAQDELLSDDTTNAMALEHPDKDIIEVVLWDINDNAKDESDDLRKHLSLSTSHLEQPQSSTNSSDNSSHSSSVDKEDIALSIIERKMKKSKTTRNLLEVERQSIDLGESSQKPNLDVTVATVKDLEEVKEPSDDKVRTLIFINKESKSMEKEMYIRPKTAIENINENRLKYQNRSISTPSLLRNDSADELLSETSLGMWFHK